MKNQTEIKCPKCDETENLIIEKSPFGFTQCGKCKYKAKHVEFMVVPKVWDDGVYPVQQELLSSPFLESADNDE